MKGKRVLPILAGIFGGIELPHKVAVSEAGWVKTPMRKREKEKRKRKRVMAKKSRRRNRRKK